jgi:DNA polymerase (family 10)
MINQELANIFYEIGYFLEMEEAAFRPQAYEKAAIVLENTEESVIDIYNKGGLKALIAMPGIGESIARKIEEYLKTGKIQYYEKWKRKVPVDIEGLMAIEGVGPKTIKILHNELGITNRKEMEEAAINHRIANLFGFGETREKNILQNIALLKTKKERFPFEKIFPLARDIKTKINSLKEVEKVDLAGSLRRREETIGDIDILAITSYPEKVVSFFVNLPDVEKIWGKGKTKASIRLKQGIDADLRVIPKISYGAALQYFTGSKEHNVALRKIAIEKGMKLNEYGLYKGKKRIAGENEKDIYSALGIAWVPPESRKGKGEIRHIADKR